MKLYRYMSITEFIKMSSGMDMKPNQIEFTNARTNSQGFCFFGENITINRSLIYGFSQLFETDTNSSISFTPEEALEFLPSMVSRDVLVEFETTENLHIKEGYGVYQNPHEMTGNWMEITEYSTLQYNSSTLIPTRFVFNPINVIYSDEKNEWEIFDPKYHYSTRDYLTKTLLEKRNIPLSSHANLRFLPPLPDSNENECWRYFETPTELSMIYGDSVNDTEKYKISFEKVDKDTYRMSPMDNVPDFWEKIYYSDLELTGDAALDYLLYATLVAHFPELGIDYFPDEVDGPYGKYSILADWEHNTFRISRLTLCVNENNQLDIGEYDENGNFISLLDILSQQFGVTYDLSIISPLQQRETELSALEEEAQLITQAEKLINTEKDIKCTNENNIGE